MVDSTGGKPHTVPPNQTGWRRIKNSLHFSLDGLRACYTGEEAFRQEVWLAAVLMPLAILLPISALSTASLIASVLLVMIVEILNSAVEAVVDRISKDHHFLSKKAKDMGSAAVFLSLVNVVIVWVCVLLTEWN
jgi:diacylglycerol kinase (ATP)